jgi:ADP-ribosylglycohydrolase
VNLRDRFRGALVGSAIKDATGRAIGALGRHDDRIAEFKEKYGLYPEMGI